MNTYHKIQSLFKRDKETNKLIVGAYSIPEFVYLEHTLWEFTEKVDGTNIRVLWDGENLTFRGKTDRANMPAPLLNNLNSMFSKDKMQVTFPESTEVCLYGEGYGAGIQKGGMYSKEQTFILFDIKIGRWWLRRDTVEEIARQLAIPSVPVIATGDLHELGHLISGNGISSQWEGATMEGIVARPVVELFARNGARIITKLKFCDFEGGD